MFKELHEKYWYYKPNWFATKIAWYAFWHALWAWQTCDWRYITPADCGCCGPASNGWVCKKCYRFEGDNGVGHFDRPRPDDSQSNSSCFSTSWPPEPSKGIKL